MWIQSTLDYLKQCSADCVSGAMSGDRIERKTEEKIDQCNFESDETTPITCLNGEVSQGRSCK